MQGSLAWNKEGSPLWRAMYNQFNVLEKATAWALGNGRRVKFWLDNWTEVGGNLLDIVVDHIPSNERFKSVKDYVKDDGDWDWGRFTGWLPSSMLLKIASIKPPSAYTGEDMMYWGWSKTGKFIVKLAFNFMKSNQWDEENGKWNYIWRW